MITKKVGGQILAWAFFRLVGPFGHLSVRPPGVGTFGRPNLRTSGRRDVRASRRSDVRTSERRDARTSRRPDVRRFGRPNVPTPGGRTLRWPNGPTRRKNAQAKICPPTFLVIMAGRGRGSGGAECPKPKTNERKKHTKSCQPWVSVTVPTLWCLVRVVRKSESPRFVQVHALFKSTPGSSPRLVQFTPY